jgi:hypothetical protein
VQELAGVKTSVRGHEASTDSLPRVGVLDDLPERVALILTGVAIVRISWRTQDGVRDVRDLGRVRPGKGTMKSVLFMMVSVLSRLPTTRFFDA